MKYAIILIIAVQIAWPGALAGQENGTGNQSGFLWKISTDSQSGFLLGTIQLTGQKGLLPLRPEIEAAFTQSTLLMAETTSEIDIHKLQKLYETLPEAEKRKIEKAFLTIFQQGMYIGEDNLKNHVTAQSYAALVKVSKEWHLDLHNLTMGKPWLTGYFIIFNVNKAMVQKREPSLQEIFIARARGKKELRLKEINILKTISKFNAAFASARKDLDSQGETILKYGLAYAERMKERDKKLISIWQARDTKALEDFAQGEMAEFPFLRKVRQNATVRLADSLVPEIISLLKDDKKCFVVWDAQLLLGPDGIIARLQQKGIRCQLLQP